MVDGYIIIAGILFYLFIIRVLGSRFLGPIAAAAILTIGYFALSTALSAAIVLARGESVWYLFGAVPIVTALLRFIFAVVVFYKVQKDEDSYMAYVGWGGLGWVLIFYVAPELAARLVFW